MTEIIPFLQSIFSHHDRVVLVGGTVRDLLLERKNQDIDLVTDISPNELAALGFRQVEATSGATIYFRHHPEFGKIEITRIETMAELERDLSRRDFTSNAMAMSLDGAMIDPLGGVADLAERKLRVCGADSFTGDPLRIFRAFRFEAAGWHMTPETSALIGQKDWATAFSTMPIERFSNEMLKALVCEMPELFFQLMIEYKVGAEFLPELFRMPFIPAGPREHHPEGDLFSHSIQVLQRVTALSSDPLPRFCAFFHDLGKLGTDPALYPKHHGHDNTGSGMAVKFCNRLCLPSAYRTALAWISSLHGKANKWSELRDSTKITMAEQALRAGIARILPMVAYADKEVNPPMTGWDATVRIAGMNTRELGIDQEKLEAMPVKNRASYILQKRVKLLKDTAS